MEEIKDKLWDPLSPATSNTEMPQPEGFPAGKKFPFDSSFIPNDPAPDVEVLFPNVGPFMCHKQVLSSCMLYEDCFNEYPETTVFYPNPALGDPRIIITYLYTGCVSLATSKPSARFLDDLIELYHVVVYEHDLDDLRKAVEHSLATYRLDEQDEEYSIENFLDLVYCSSRLCQSWEGLDEDLREKMLRPHVKDYVQRLVAGWQNDTLAVPFPSKAAAGFLGDMLRWQSEEHRSSIGEMVLELMSVLASRTSTNRGRSTLFQSHDDYKDGYGTSDVKAEVDEAVEGMHDMVIDGA